MVVSPLYGTHDMNPPVLELFPRAPAEVMTACQEAEQWQQVLKFLQGLSRWAPGDPTEMWCSRWLKRFIYPMNNG